MGRDSTGQKTSENVIFPISKRRLTVVTFQYRVPYSAQPQSLWPGFDQDCAGHVRKLELCTPVAKDRLHLRITLKTVLARTGLSRSTLYRKIGEGSFPRRVKISVQGAGWHESAINRWITNPAAWHQGNAGSSAQ